MYGHHAINIRLYYNHLLATVYTVKDATTLRKKDLKKFFKRHTRKFAKVTVMNKTVVGSVG